MRSTRSPTIPLGIILQSGPRVCLRAPRARDREEYLALNRLSRDFHRGRASPPTRPEGFARYLARCRGPDYRGLLVCRRSDGAILGGIELSHISGGNSRNAFLGYQIGAPHAGQGYMREALELAIRHAFGKLKLHRLEANIQPTNAASIALARRLGFEREGFSRRYLKICGRWRDHERWAILAEDWRRHVTRPRGRRATRRGAR